MGIFSFACFLGSLKVHIALAVVELSLTIVFALLTGAFLHVAQGNAGIASNLQTVSIGNQCPPCEPVYQTNLVS
jgi:succinate-acetate transporter protein